MCSQSSCPNLTASTQGERQPLQVFKFGKPDIFISFIILSTHLQIIRGTWIIIHSCWHSFDPKHLIYRSNSNCHTETFLFKAGAQSTKMVQCQAYFARWALDFISCSGWVTEFDMGLRNMDVFWAPSVVCCVRCIGCVQLKLFLRFRVKTGCPLSILPPYSWS